jgi:secreted Zn-dependent insulinase-like peptidase
MLKLKEKDINFMMEYNRNFEQIASHRYNFNSREMDALALEKITSSDFKQFFERLFFSE